MVTATVNRSQAKSEKSDNTSYASNYADDRFTVTPPESNTH